MVSCLASRSRARADAARARLSIVGEEAVDALVEALEGSDNRLRARVMPLLAAIQDPRGREPLIAMLLDRQARMRLIAARCLARFPDDASVAALERAVRRERRDDVRRAAISALVEQFSAGQDGAARAVVNVLLDAGECDDVRLAAFALLPHLGARQQKGVLRRLSDDASHALRRLADRFADGNEEAQRLSARSVPAWVERLADEDYVVWNEAVQRLSASGEATIDPLIDEMCRRSEDPEYCSRAAIVLKSLGPRRCRACIGAALDRVCEPLPLQTLVEVVGALGDRALIYRLKELIERLASQPIERSGFSPCLRVRARAHLELARMGSRVAIADLRDSLHRSDLAPEPSMLAAVARIGKRDELGLLLSVWLRVDEVTRRRVGEVVREIMKRERIRRNARVFKTLSVEHRTALERILPPAGNRRRAAAARPSKR